MRSVGQINGTFAAKEGEDDTFEEMKFDVACCMLKETKV